MSKKEQVAVMLEENMQRNDLTIWEQANGFQMMIDLGQSEEEIAEKTGFSKTTVHHRLNIAKLNQKELKKKEQDENFQLSLKDLYELEKVKNIRTRNKILREAFNSQNLASRAKFSSSITATCSFLLIPVTTLHGNSSIPACFAAAHPSSGQPAKGFG